MASMRPGWWVMNFCGDIQNLWMVQLYCRYRTGKPLGEGQTRLPVMS
jgi:hypothetical protein